MTRSTKFFALLLLAVQSLLSNTIIVDKSGLGEYTSIQAGVNAALAGDTVKVIPGVYNEQINISTSIVVQGSGYENTQIVANADPAVSMSSGKMMWFAISSNTGNGITMSGGTVTNCVVWNSPKYGVNITGGTTAIIQNCDLVNNKYSSSQAYISSGSTGTFINCILWANTSSTSNPYTVIDIYGTLNGLYSVFGVGVGGYSGCISSNPQFTSSTDFTLSGGSPCIDTGKPDIYDPDGSRSDMGYYGGPDAPVFPVVTNLRIYLNPDGSVNVQATAQSRY